MSDPLRITPSHMEELAHAAHAAIEIDPVTRVGHLEIDGEHYVANVPEKDAGPTYGLCSACNSIEVALLEVTGIRDFSDIGESARYPVGYGCELCS